MLEGREAGEDEQEGRGEHVEQFEGPVVDGDLVDRQVELCDVGERPACGVRRQGARTDLGGFPCCRGTGLLLKCQEVGAIQLYYNKSYTPRHPVR